MMSSGPRAARLPDGRLHLNHGPIDLIIEAFGTRSEIETAYVQAERIFQTVLTDLSSELVLLRTQVGTDYPALHGPVARRMAAAVWPLRESFITPMAAVAGAVADHVLYHMVRGCELNRAYVNNGGDIALHLSPKTRFEAGLVCYSERPAWQGNCSIEASMPIRGIATSGWRGRSFSLGIADSVTVLAYNAAYADAAATLIANAVTVEHPGIIRQAACELNPDSDLGSQPVTTAVNALNDDAIITALEKGCVYAESLRSFDLIYGAALFLQNHYRISGPLDSHLQITPPRPDATLKTPD